MFIIMNPPYGKASSLSRKILNTILETIPFKEVICLATIKTNFDQWEHLSKIEGPFKSATFEISKANNIDLYTTTFTPTSINANTFMEIVLNKNQLAYYNAVNFYNQVHKKNYIFLKEMVVKNREKYKQYPEHLIFEISIHTPAGGIHFTGVSADHNLNGKAIIWKNNVAENGIFFNTKEEFNNFSNWYYSHPRNFENNNRSIKSLMDLCLSILLHYGPGPSILKYEQVWPNLDWSRTWADEEIIQELKDKAGLPQDWSLYCFLENNT